MRRVVAVVVAMTTGSAGCLVADSLSGLTGYGPAISDAAVVTDSPGSPEAPMDDGGATDAPDSANDSTTHPDVLGGPEAGMDVDTAPRDASGSFCKGFDVLPTLCSDFDEGQPYNTGWDNAYLGAGGEVAVFSGSWLSSPSSIRCTIPSFDPDAGFPSANLGFTLQQLASKLRVEAAIRIVSENSADNFQAISIFQLNGALILAMGPTSGYVWEQGPGVGHGMDIPNFVLGDWHTYILDLETGNPGTLTVTVDGSVVIGPVALELAWPASGLSTDVGIGYSGDGNAKEADFDNIVVDVQ